MWSERAPQHTVEGKVFPRILALGAVLWTPDNSREPFEQFHAKLTKTHIAKRLKKLNVVCSDGLALPPKPIIPCRVTTSIGVYQNYHPECAFDGDPGSHYWSNRAPRIGDVFEIEFMSPLDIKRAFQIRIHTGKPLGPDQDRLESAAIEILTGSGQWTTIGSVSQGVGNGRIEGGMSIARLRIRVLTDQQMWLSIREILLVEYH